jgi:ATP adenylyltransferase
MKYLWAPWRMEYILEKKQKGCIFCEKPKEKKDKRNLILYQDKYALVMLNKFPYNNGHVMVVPKHHCSDLTQLGDKESQELFYLLKDTTRLLKTILHPHGFNIGMNLGKIAGAGVEDHVHFHIVPRWNGDTNFMPILGKTKIVPDYLEITYDSLHPVFEELLQKKRRRKGGRKK